MTKTLAQIAELVQGKIEGDAQLQIKNIASLESAKEGDLSFVTHPRYSKNAVMSNASAFVIAENIEDLKRPVIKVKKPQLAMAKILAHYYLKPQTPTGIHENAVIGRNVKLGKDLSIYPFVYIADDAEIGSRCTIYPFVFIGKGSKIGDDAIVHPNVSIYHNVSVGKRVILHSGVVIGSDGFGYAQDQGKNLKIPQVGKIIVEDDVEIGANTAVDRATLDETTIGAGTKVDNLVQIGHNVKIGENSILVGQCGISGSSKIGKNVVLAGQVGVSDHVNIGDNTIVIAKAGVVSKNIPANSVFSGIPAIPHNINKKFLVSIPKIPDLLKSFKELEERVKALEEKK